MQSPKYFQELIEKELANFVFPASPAELYEPIRYMLSLGGKRLRPTLLLMSNELFGASPEKVINPALGIEVFHNFTLMHDDIMDRAPLRRSRATVHTRWNPNIAILSGDTMFVKSCQLMMQVDKIYQEDVMDLFLKTAVEVCEGQQMDMNFEGKEEVSIPEYIEMITMKTAVLLACSLQTGAMLAGAPLQDSKLMYDFGKNLGIAFQLHDDILDLYAEDGKFGKQIGGDILSNKKTILLLNALDSAGDHQMAELKKWMSTDGTNAPEKVEAVKEIFESLDVRSKAEQEMERYFQMAMSDLHKVNALSSNKEMLAGLAEKLMIRQE